MATEREVEKKDTKKSGIKLTNHLVYSAFNACFDCASIFKDNRGLSELESDFKTSCKQTHYVE